MSNHKDYKSKKIPSYNKIEKVVTAIWKEILQCENINPEDDFFEKGGDSIMTMMVYFRVKEELNLDLMPYDLLESSNFFDFCRLIEKNLNKIKKMEFSKISQCKLESKDTGVI